MTRATSNRRLPEPREPTPQALSLFRLRTLIASPSRCRGQKGFSLIEMALVLLTISILLSFAVPRFSLLAGRQLDSSAARVRALCAWLGDEASLRGRVYRLEFGPDGEEWAVSMLTPWAQSASEDAEPQFQPHWDAVEQSGTFPTGVHVERLDFDTEPAGANSSHIYFLPQGPAQDVHIELENQEGERRRVFVDASSAKVSIEDDIEDAR